MTPAMERLIIGVDVGGTNLRSSLVDGDGRIVERRRCASRIEEGRAGFCERLLAEISALKDAAVVRGRRVWRRSASAFPA